MELKCICGHNKDQHVANESTACLHCASCFGWQPNYPQPPQVLAKRPTPEIILRDIRKFALEQAIKMMPYLQSGVTAVEVAATYEDYILNGKADK